MIEKYVFIISNIHLPRCVNRVNEFVGRGFQVDVYYFDRPLFKSSIKKVNAPLYCLGELKSGKSSYFGRMFHQYKKVKSVIKKYENTNSVIYLFGFDMAVIYSLCNSRLPYIFEESDLRHTYIKPPIIGRLLEWYDKKLIDNSFLTVFTSEGFSQYHYGRTIKENTCVIPNRLDPSIVHLNTDVSGKSFNPNNIKIGFVGSIRFKTVYNFVKVFCSNFPQHEFHFYGSPVLDNIEQLNQYNNCYFHGAFSSPKDLPNIYANIDLVLSTYDTDFENALYAEPNKMYESIYFEVPIIVSSNTYVAEKVKSMGIGYDINAMNEDDIIKFVVSLSKEDLYAKREMMARIPKSELLSINDALYEKLKQKSGLL